MSIALLVIRLVVGLLFVGHGGQKLRDSARTLRSGEPAGAVGFSEALGLRPALPATVLAGVAEAGGGFLLASGLVTPLGAALIAAVMTTAILLVHLRKGIWGTNGGFEFPLVMLTSAFLISALGPGSYSLDSWIGWNDWLGVWAYRPVTMAGAAIGAGVVLGLLAVARSRLPGLLSHRHHGDLTPHPA